MIFIERKKETGYSYELEDIFGALEIESAIKLNAEQLDEIVVNLIRQNIKAERLEGEVILDEKQPNEKLKYVFIRRPLWEAGEKDEDEICNDIPTSTEKPESE